jgi:putative ABC transport system permease protein
VSIRQKVVARATPSAATAVVRVPAALGKVRIVTQGGHKGIELTNTVPLYLATPALLEYYGIKAGDVDADTDVISGRSDVKGLTVMAPRGGPTPCDSSQSGCRVNGRKPAADEKLRGPYQWHPKVQIVKLPTYTAAPDTMLTMHALHAFGLQPVPAGWLIETRGPLTVNEINAARRSAAAGGITINTHRSEASYSRLRNGATAVGLLVALGVLAMTVGLIRSETADDLRTLAATGATSTTRRTLTGATAGALALLGALLGTGAAYLALVAWHRSDLHPLTHVPLVDLVVIVVGLPLIAVVGGWLLAGREPADLGHRPLD